MKKLITILICSAFLTSCASYMHKCGCGSEAAACTACKEGSDQKCIDCKK